MKKTTTPKRFLSIRLTETELKVVQIYFKASACNSLTEYVKNVLTKKPVIVKMRNQSGDDLLEGLINIKNKLTLIEDQLAEKNITQLGKDLADIERELNRLYRFSILILTKYSK